MSQKRLTDRQVRAQIYGVLVSHLRKHCLVDGDDVDIDRYHTLQVKIADQFEKRYCKPADYSLTRPDDMRFPE